MAKKSKLIHGERNKILAKKLHLEKEYYDWSITASFYSSIHLLEHKLLPVKVGSLTCKNISEVKNAYNQKGRHIARLTLIRDKCPHAIAFRYKWLDNKSRYSRYTTYKVTPSESSKSSEYLDFIHKYTKT